MPRADRLPLPPVVALLISAFSVQGGAALAKGLFPALGAAGTTAFRVALSALLLLAFFRPALGRITARQWAFVLPYGLSLGAMNLTFYLALARIPLGLAVTLEFLGPLAVALLGSRHLVDLLWVALAAAGIVLLSGLGAAVEAALDPVGVALALAAACCWAIYILVGGAVSRRLPREGEGVSAGMLVAALAVFPFGLSDLGAASFTPSLLGVGLLMAILSSALPYTLEMRALRALPSRTFGILMSLEPGIAALVGHVALGEVLTLRQWLAIVFISAASAGATLTARRVRPPIET